jgi:hypothetical protein
MELKIFIQLIPPKIEGDGEKNASCTNGQEAKIFRGSTLVSNLNEADIGA